MTVVTETFWRAGKTGPHPSYWARLAAPGEPRERQALSGASVRAVNQATRKCTAIKISGAVTAAATGINNVGDIVGLATDSGGNTFSWLLKSGHLTRLQFPGGSDTQAFGVNDKDRDRRLLSRTVPA